MSSQGATPAMSGNVFTGFTETEKKFLQDLETFLVNYPNYAGTTPYEVALARTLAVSVTVTGERALQVPCKKWCVGAGGRLYCCVM